SPLDFADAGNAFPHASSQLHHDSILCLPEASEERRGRRIMCSCSGEVLVERCFQTRAVAGFRCPKRICGGKQQQKNDSSSGHADPPSFLCLLCFLCSVPHSTFAAGRKLHTAQGLLAESDCLPQHAAETLRSRRPVRQYIPGH